MIVARLANRHRNGYLKLSIHWRTRYSVKSSSTSYALQVAPIEIIIWCSTVAKVPACIVGPNSPEVLAIL